MSYQGKKTSSIQPLRSDVVVGAERIARRGGYRAAFDSVARGLGEGSITRDQHIGAHFSLCAIALEAEESDFAVIALEKAGSNIRPHNLRLRMMVIENSLDIARKAGARGDVKVKAAAAKTAFVTAGFDEPRATPVEVDRKRSVNSQTKALEGFDGDVMDYFEEAVKALAQQNPGAARGVLNDTLTRLGNRKIPNKDFLDVVTDLKSHLDL